MAKLREKVINEPLLNLTELKSINDSLADNGVLANVINLGFYKLDKTSTLTADDFLVVTTLSGVGRWLNISNWQGTPTTTVGGIPAGVAVPNTPVPLLLDQMLRPYQSPAFTAFNLSGADNLEIGAAFTGIQTFSWTISNTANVIPNSVYITDVTNNLALINAHSIVSPESYDFSTYPTGGIVNVVPATNVFQIQATNTKSIVFSRNKNKNWYRACYYGSNVNAVLGNAEILALENKVISGAFPPLVSFAGGTKYFWYWVPESIAQPTTFIDSTTGVPVDMELPILQTVTNIYGLPVPYYGYRSTFKLIEPVTIAVS